MQHRPNPTVDNTASVTAATYANGLDTNDASDVETNDVLPAGGISGTIWQENSAGTNGWVDATVGYEAGTDTFLPGVEVDLWACVDGTGTPIYPAGNSSRSCTHTDNGGTWQVIDTTYTDANGNYNFTVLLDGFYRGRPSTAAAAPLRWHTNG